MAQRAAATVNLPVLAQYRSLADYVPAYGDYVVWSGWFTTWHGVVSKNDPESGDVAIIWSGLPYLLFTLEPDEQAKETRKMKLATLRNSARGKFAVQQHDIANNANVWYL